jgi:hypothetical protein
MPFNPEHGSIHPDQVRIEAAVLDYADARVAADREFGQTGRHGAAYDKVCVAYRNLRTRIAAHFRSHWFNAVPPVPPMGRESGGAVSIRPVSTLSLAIAGSATAAVAIQPLFSETCRPVPFELSNIFPARGVVFAGTNDPQGTNFQVTPRTYYPPVVRGTERGEQG